MTLPRIELTADGSATLRSSLNGDTYHSLRGAVGEARHVFIETGFLHASRLAMTEKVVRVLEMGFGTGLNAWLTLEEAARTGTRVEYTAVELHPVPREVAAQLNYTSDERFMALHDAPWDGWSELSPGLSPSAFPRQPAADMWAPVDETFRLRKLKGSMADILAASGFSSTFDCVYWDAFAPDTQPELWTPELFARVYDATAPGGVLVTYSSKGDVRRALQSAGFVVEKLPGALGKRHMLKATKIGN